MKQQSQHDQIALTIQQPWADLILRGIKSVEVRSVPVGMRTTIYLYASQNLSLLPAATVAIRDSDINVTELPKGKIVGTVEIVDCQPCIREDAKSACIPWKLMKGQFSWKLENPQRYLPPLKAHRVPYGMWFYPFKTKITKSQKTNTKK
jgi:hypothetical protein